MLWKYNFVASSNSKVRSVNLLGSLNCSYLQTLDISFFKSLTIVDRKAFKNMVGVLIYEPISLIKNVELQNEVNLQLLLQVNP